MSTTKRRKDCCFPFTWIAWTVCDSFLVYFSATIKMKRPNVMSISAFRGNSVFFYLRTGDYGTSFVRRRPTGFHRYAIQSLDVYYLNIYKSRDTYYFFQRFWHFWIERLKFFHRNLQWTGFFSRQKTIGHKVMKWFTDDQWLWCGNTEYPSSENHVGLQMARIKFGIVWMGRTIYNFSIILRVIRFNHVLCVAVGDQVDVGQPKIRYWITNGKIDWYKL